MRVLAVTVFLFTALMSFSMKAASQWDYKIWFSKRGEFVWCGTHKSTQNDDIQVSRMLFTDLKNCIDSKEFQRLKNLMNDKPYKNPYMPGEPKPTIIVDNKLKRYIIKFQEKTGVSIGKTTIKFGNLKDNKLGICYGKTRQIIIDKDYWLSSTSELDKEMTVYHELAHCVLNRKHSKSMGKTFLGDRKPCPKSLMHNISFGKIDSYRCFNLNRDYYWRELRTGSFTVKVKEYTASKGLGKQLKFVFINHGVTKLNFSGFKCTIYLSDVITKTKGIVNGILRGFISVECTRDGLIIHNLHFNVVTAVGSKVWFRALAQGGKLNMPTIFLTDKILNTGFMIQFAEFAHK